MHIEVFAHFKKQSFNIVQEKFAVYTKKGFITQKRGVEQFQIV